MPGCTIFNGRGDLTLAWDEPDDEHIIAMIEAKMQEGFTFFLLEPRLGGMAPPNKIPLTQPRDALRQRTVALQLSDGDIAVAGLIEDGRAAPVKTPDKPAKTTRRAKTAKEAAAGETVAVKPKRGG